MPLYLDTPPSETPVSVEEAKAHLRVTTNDEDGLITSLIKAATAHAEQVTGRAIVTQSWVKVLDSFPDGAIELKAALASVTEIKFIERFDEVIVDDEVTLVPVEKILNPAHYQADPYRLPGWVMPAYGYQWPEARATVNAVKVKFVCGFGAATSVPDDVKSALLLLIGHLYENREASTERALTEVPFAFDALIGPYRILNIV